VALIIGSTVAGGANVRQSASVQSGTLLFFRGTSTQCLVFGPIATIKGKRGILCFKGPPRQRRSGTRWVSSTPTTVSSSTSGTESYVAITSRTNIRKTTTMSLNSTFNLAGVNYSRKGKAARLGCRFQVIRGVPDPGGKAVVCADVDSRGPIPGGSGFVITQRAVAVVEFASANGNAKIDVSWRQPRCSCDK
jgi:hypothetical protein